MQLILICTIVVVLLYSESYIVFYKCSNTRAPRSVREMSTSACVLMFNIYCLLGCALYTCTYTYGEIAIYILYICTLADWVVTYSYII